MKRSRFIISSIPTQNVLAKLNIDNMSDSSPLQIAIVGAGIAGLTAAIALSQHPHINITIYEAATELKEIGASIALGPNGLRTLERLGLDNAISDEVAFRGPQEIPMIYRHVSFHPLLYSIFIGRGLPIWFPG